MQGVYSASVVERGKVLASAGNCMECHTRVGGEPYAGGRAMRTPYGVIYSTNLTPDAENGIGAWSFSAFERAMREGISRDGHRLYPAFPYTSFTGMTDEDLTALYAYLQSRPAVGGAAPPAEMRFPYGARPLMAAWNALYLKEGVKPVNPAKSETWNRGAYLVGSVGHCSACHSPRDVLGGERQGLSYLAGAVNDGWEAPPLTSLSQAPVPWTSRALFEYLRQGYSAQHGTAAGPMAQVIHSLSALPDTDVQAMAEYLASLSKPTSEREATRLADAAVNNSRAVRSTLLGPSQRLFESACGACHHEGKGAVQSGLNLSLELNSGMHSDDPRNLIRTILVGIRTPGVQGLGYMPAFERNLDDKQIAGLVTYLRARYAPERDAWTNLEQEVIRVRSQLPKD